MSKRGTSPAALPRTVARFASCCETGDCKYVARFDQVFAADGTRVIRTPIQAPKANSFAERWIETLRADCIDWTLIIGPRHLDRVLRTYVGRCNAARPHRGMCAAAGASTVRLLAYFTLNVNQAVAAAVLAAVLAIVALMR